MYNALADTLSRLDCQTFRKFKPGASQNMILPVEIQYYGQTI